MRFKRWSPTRALSLCPQILQVLLWKPIKIMEVFIMKTFFAFTTGLFFGAVGIATIYLASPDVQEGWQAMARTLNN